MFTLIVKGNARDALAALSTQIPLDDIRVEVANLAQHGQTILRVTSKTYLNASILNWWMVKHRDAPFPPGALLYWTER